MSSNLFSNLLTNFNIFMGMIFIAIALLQARLHITIIIPFLVKGDIRNDFLQDSVKQWLYIRLDSKCSGPNNL